MCDRLRGGTACFSLWLLLAGVGTASADLLHRWSFEGPAGGVPNGTVLMDSVSGLPMTVRGVGALLEGGRMSLPGSTTAGEPQATISAYLDLPNGIISSKTDLTLEFWAAPLGGREWAPLFEFGRWTAAGDGFGEDGEWTGQSAVPPPVAQSHIGMALLLSRGSDLNLQRMGVTMNGVRTDLDTGLPTTPGQLYHYVFTVVDGAGVFGAAGMQAGWYRDGVLVGTIDLNYRLEQIVDVNCWLGRLQWTSLGMANVAYDEARLYDHAFDAGEVAASGVAGPDAVFGPAVLVPDVAALHHGQKVLVSVLANDPGGVAPGSVEVVQTPAFGTAVPDGEGGILYHHVTGTPLTDLFTYRAAFGGGTSDPVTVTIEFSGDLRIPNLGLNVPGLPPPTAIELVPAYGGLVLSEPICVASPPGETNRLFVVERRVGVRLIQDLGSGSPGSAVFLDLANLLAGRGESLGDTFDQGVMGLAFHPGYSTNRHFFLFYSARVAGLDYFRVSRFTAEAGNPDEADVGSEQVFLQQRDQNGYHLGTDIHFGPDGYLYVATGDGGGQNDSRGYGQLIDHDFFCAILRLDVDKRPGNPEPNAHPSVPLVGGVARYSVPVDNPYVTEDPTVLYNGANLPAGSVRTEFWANGLRNPWRFSFDGVTGELWSGDVGQNAREEVNLITGGGNYGWSLREGTVAGPRVGETPPGFVGVPPLYEYGPGNGEFQGFSISGGLVYRGSSVSRLNGAYVFSDYVSGNIWALRRTESGVDVERVAGEAGITSFGIDPATGDLLAVDHGGSRILRFVSGADDVGTFPRTLSETRLFADLSDLSPAPGLLPYFPNLRFWSDYAAKSRWFVIPDATNRMVWEPEGAWTYPDGMIWVKHFDLELERGNPASSRRMETRLLVKNAGGSYGVSYRWNEAETDATLVPDAGDSFPVDVMVGGMPVVQNYRIPSRAECLACHTPQAGHALSFDTRQLNRVETVHGFFGNQISLLHAAGYLENTPDSPNLLPRHLRPEETDFPVEARVRSYLAVNCASCHRAGGTAPPSWDARAELTLAETGLIGGMGVNNGGNPANRLIVPGDLAHSIVLNRVGVLNGFSRMPQLGSNELDQESIALLSEWIGGSLTNRQDYGQWRLARFASEVSPEGEPGANPDGDARTNWEEFLEGSDPLDSGSVVVAAVEVAGGTVTFSVDLPPNRSVRVDQSADLLNWVPWDVPGNEGLPLPGGMFDLSGPAAGPLQFFRYTVEEN